VAYGKFTPAREQLAGVLPDITSPVPLMVIESITMTKQAWPLLDLLTAPLSVTFECGI